EQDPHDPGDPAQPVRRRRHTGRRPGPRRSPAGGHSRRVGRVGRVGPRRPARQAARPLDGRAVQPVRREGWARQHHRPGANRRRHRHEPDRPLPAARRPQARAAAGSATADGRQCPGRLGGRADPAGRRFVRRGLQGEPEERRAARASGGGGGGGAFRPAGL
ncbi:MAG: hypothetical protein AVDCRST_MAG64-2661, partial [uncultured Phycisphaerae bacterium]